MVLHTPSSVSWPWKRFGRRAQQGRVAERKAMIDRGRRLPVKAKRLDRAIARYFDTGEATDEINPPND
jgi:hypothetical protein